LACSCARALGVKVVDRIGELYNHKRGAKWVRVVPVPHPKKQKKKERVH